MSDMPELSTTEVATVKDRVRAAYQTLFPDAVLPAALQATERGAAPAGATVPGVTAITLAERSYSGLLVALWLDPEQSGQLAIAGGEDAAALHLTLAYVPDMAGTDDVTLARIVASLADVAALYGPITGKIGGFGRFFAGDSSDGQDCFIALPDIGSLDYFREAVLRALGDVWVYTGSDHSYQPHITLGYLAPKAKTPAAPPAIDLTFRAITVVAGDRRIDIPFHSSEGTEYVGMFDGDPSYGYYAERTTARPGSGNVRDAWRFSSPVELVEPAEWIQYLPGPGTYHHALWGELDFTADKLGRIVENFRDHVYQQELPVDIDHEYKLSGAVGYIRDMRLNQAGAIEVKVDWTDRGDQLLKEDRFKYVSAEFFDEWQDPVTGDWIRDVPVGMAITTHPHFKTDVLRPLAASEFASSPIAGAARQERIAVGDKNELDTPGVAQQFSEAEILAFREFQTLGGAAKLTELTGEITKLSERNTRLEADARKKRFTDVVRGRAEGSDGTAWTGDVEEHVTMLTDLATQFGDDSGQVNRYIAINTAAATQFAEASKELFTARGTGQGGDEAQSATDEVGKLATARMQATQGLTYSEAVSQVFKERPDLYRQYSEEQR